MTPEERWNARLKLFADWVSNLAVALVAAGSFAPAAQWIFGLLPQNADPSVIYGFSFICVIPTFAGAMDSRRSEMTNGQIFALSMPLITATAVAVTGLLLRRSWAKPTRNKVDEEAFQRGRIDYIRNSVQTQRRLARSDPAQFEPGLAGMLYDLSENLSYAGDQAAALEPMQESASIYRRIVWSNPASLEPNLASSLKRLSNLLSHASDNAAALKTMQEAVGVYRRLAQSNPARFEPDLAIALSGLSQYLRTAGDNVAALAAFQEAANIFPVDFEPDPAEADKTGSNPISKSEVH